MQSYVVTNTNTLLYDILIQNTTTCEILLTLHYILK